MLSYYEILKGRNIIGATKHLLRQGILELRFSDGKLFPAAIKNTWETPWSHQRSSYRSNCYIWKDIIFENIVMTVLPQEMRFVPSGCQNCYKVVVRPKTLKQLFALEELQRRLDLASKCGIEIRPRVFGLYGGYFYNRGLDEGIQCYKIVRQAVDEDKELGPDVAIILKRACTEMEHGVGPSDKWVITEEQKQFEALIDELIVTDVPYVSQTPHAKDHVHQLWIEKAYEWGDTTVYEYLDGKPLYPALVTYHHLADEKKEPEKKKANQ